jgi:hypothetical protein
VVRGRGSGVAGSDDGGGTYSSPHLPLSLALHLPHSPFCRSRAGTTGPSLATAGPNPVTTGPPATACPDPATVGPDPAAGSLELEGTTWTRWRQARLGSMVGSIGLARLFLFYLNRLMEAGSIKHLPPLI